MNSLKKIFLLCLILFLFSTAIQSQWTLQNYSLGNHLYSIFFIDPNTGWAGGINGLLLKTTNSGENWYNLNSTVSESIQDVFFSDANSGWIVTRVIGKILHSTDGGNSWFIQEATNDKSFNSIFFLNNQTGWVAGYGAGSSWVFRTTNSGQTWDSSFISRRGGYSIYFINDMTGWTGGDPALIKTTDGGITWNNIIEFWQGNIMSIEFLNQNTGYFQTEVYKTYKTTDQGLNWNLISSFNGGIGSYDFTILNESIAYICGTEGKIYKSTNGGYNWLQQETGGNPAFFESIVFLNDTLGWAAGGNEKIMHTTNGGTFVGIENKNMQIPEASALSQNYPNPFNPLTKINFYIKEKGFVELIVYDVMGKLITKLINKSIAPSEYEVSLNADEHNLSSGLYFYTLILNGKRIETKKMIVLK